MTNLGLIWEAILKTFLIIYVDIIFTQEIAQQFSTFNDLIFSKC